MVGLYLNSLTTSSFQHSKIINILFPTRNQPLEVSESLSKLNKEELKNGCKLGLDTWADTGCSGKHTYVKEFIIGKIVTAMGFSLSLGNKNLKYAHVLYAYDQEDGSVLVILEYNNTIYLCDAMQDSLSNPLQSEEMC